MKNKRVFRVSLLTVILIISCSMFASAAIWSFGTSGQGQNPFTAKGFAIKKDNGKIEWLYSKFDNGGYDTNGNMIMQDGGTRYTGIDNGVKYMNATRADGSPYQLYAFTNRNPRVYYYIFAYQKNSKNGSFKKVDNFEGHLGAPIRTSENLTEFPNGLNQQWAIPINSFKFSPGTLYEFGFYQGMQANNGITLTLAEDGLGHYYGYYQNPTGDELKICELHKYIEYQFISSYEIAGNDSKGNYYNVRFVPMRFSVQTYADLTKWNKKSAEVNRYINGISSADYNKNKRSIDNLKSKLNSLQTNADNVVKKQLQIDANASIDQMIAEINAAVEATKSETGILSDTSELNKTLTEANDFYNKVKDKIGYNIGNYSEKDVNALKQTIDEAGKLTSQDLQSDIDVAVINLNNAIKLVKSSQVKTDKIILDDHVNGINVILKKGTVPDDVSLIVVRLEENDEKYKSIKKSLGNKVYDLLVYNILLYSGDKKIEPKDGSMTIQFSVPNLMRKNEIAVFYASDDLNPERIQSSRTESTVIVNNDDPGYFLLVNYGEKLNISKDGDSNSNSKDQNKTKDSINNIKVKKTPLNSSPNQSKKADVIKQTDLDTKEPDKIENVLDFVNGKGDENTSIKLKGYEVKKEAIENTTIPKDEVLKQSNPIWLLISSSVLGTFGLVYGGLEIVKRFKK